MIVLAALIFLAGCAQRPPAPEILPQGVRFSFFAPAAKSVALAGSFNRWNAEEGRMAGPDEKGRWSIIVPLERGRHEYRFVIDGHAWVLDPSQPSVDDGFGGENSVLWISR